MLLSRRLKVLIEFTVSLVEFWDFRIWRMKPINKLGVFVVPGTFLAWDFVIVEDAKGRHDEIFWITATMGEVWYS